MTQLADRQCVPCQGGTPPLTGEALAGFQKQVSSAWQVVKEHHIEREFSFKNFREALDFTVEVGELAESVGHHPDIFLAWGKVKVTFFTHKVDGLTDSDFVMAAKIDRLRPA